MQLRRAAEEGATTIVVTSTDLCRPIRNASNSMDACFEAMQAEIKPGDVVLDQSSGNAMAIRYLLPRSG
jgi:UDP-N-acetylmuramate-alanine ligase